MKVILQTKCLFGAFIIAVFVGACGQRSNSTQKWSEPVVFSSGRPWSISRWNNTLLLQLDRTNWLRLRDDLTTWDALQLPEFSDASPALLAAKSNVSIFAAARISEGNQQLEIHLAQASIRADHQVTQRSDKRLILTRREVFGGAPPENPFHFEVGPRSSAGSGFTDGSFFLLPYRMHSVEVGVSSTGTRQKSYGTGPAEVGVFHGTNWEGSWQKSKLFTFESYNQTVHATEASQHILADERNSAIWWSRKDLATTNQWTKPEVVTSTLYHGGCFVTDSVKDTLHVCWLDDRRKRSTIGAILLGDVQGNVRNNQIFYRQKRDGNANWSREVLLSGRMSYVQNPTLSAEGNQIVVTWQYHTGSGVNPRADIFVTTSQNNGVTWSSPEQITPSGGLSAESPVVALHQGIVHIFYSHGGNVVYRRGEMRKQ